jgi:5-formyltetrahydrofolate cyclo-ligase
MSDPMQPASAKVPIRTAMRAARRSLADRPVRSEAIWAHVQGMGAVIAAQRVLVFTAIGGEPDTAGFVDWCRSNGKQTAVPEDEVDPAWPDIVVLPGLAFTIAGDRLGQGGGWYDRFLTEVRADCTKIGVGFDLQLVDHLPVESHDVRLDCVVTESGPHFAS